MNMEPLMQQKREAAMYIPYRKESGAIRYFLQMRDKDAERAPGVYGIFGGGFEDSEDMMQALHREVREELTIDVRNPVYFSKYEFARSKHYVFLEEVGVDFENTVDVKEGQYGKFLSLAELQALREVSPICLTVIAQVDMKLIES